mmetsp:Transcript_43749/g.93096  ORF Transcript_43749/g.93096 Transcript_43749/m.93096 type:complete len:216 (-) Transcript_43749:1311-1958(-)
MYACARRKSALELDSSRRRASVHALITADRSPQRSAHAAMLMKQLPLRSPTAALASALACALAAGGMPPSASISASISRSAGAARLEASYFLRASAMAPRLKRAVPAALRRAWHALFSSTLISCFSLALTKSSSASSTSTSAEGADALPPAGRSAGSAPYAQRCGAVTRLVSPRFISRTAASMAGSTSPAPWVKVRAAVEGTCSTSWPLGCSHTL